MSRLVMVCAALLAGCAPFQPSSESPALGQGQFLADTFNNRNYKLYLPSTYSSSSPPPLVLMLHGCTEDPDSFAQGTQMNTVAEENGFLALYPDQPTSANQLKCWTWFDAADQARGQGEPADLVALVDHVAQTYPFDAAHAYVAGLSAGAAMAVILGATYPDRFSAIAVAEGLEFAAATSANTSVSVLSSGGPDPVQQGQAALAAMGANRRAVRAIVFHGSADQTVAPVNGTQVVAQWAATDDVATDGVADGNVRATPDSTEMATVPNGRSYTIDHHLDQHTGKEIIAFVSVSGMPHAWPGGASGQPYTDPTAPDASEQSWRFFSGQSIGGSGASDGGAGGAGGTTTTKSTSGCSFGDGSASGLGLVGLALMAAFALRPRRRRPARRCG